MPNEEKIRAFESESLILPALKMVLVDAEKDPKKRAAIKAKQKAKKDFNEETVLRIIDKLIAKE